MPKAKETVLEINLQALKHNFIFLKNKLQKNTKFLAVVKAFAYGSDAIEIAKALNALNIDYLAVAYSSEGQILRNAGIKTPILVLHPLEINFNTIISNALEPNLYSINALKAFIALAENRNLKNYPIQLKINTGLNRLGLSKNDLIIALGMLKNTKAVQVSGILSHLAASDDRNETPFTHSQIKQFSTLYNTCCNHLGYKPIKHLCNTSGILNYPEAHFDMVRSGIGLYGFGNDTKYNTHLKPIASLKTIISQIHNIKKGDSIGYNRGFIAKQEIKTATLPIGHADGISRIYGHGKGFVFINGKKAFILGNVCMDMIMVDITKINCKVGDEVIIFNNYHTAEQLTNNVDTISYEIIASVSQRVKRVFYR